jgi:transcriptional regulator with XRE-family HTH domain
MSEVPEEMRKMAEQKGIKPSMRAIATAAGVSTSAVSRVISGQTTQETVSKVARALGVDDEVIFAMSGLSVEGRKPWFPPLRESFLLDQDVRAALDSLVRAIAKGGTGVATQPRRGEVGLDLHPVTAQVKADSELAGRNVPRSSRGRARVVRRRPKPSTGNREVKGDEGATSEADD